MRKKGKFLFIIFLLALLFACRPSVHDDTLHYGLGPGWYQQGKNPRQMIDDFDACRALAREKDSDPFVENDCMRNKGYTLK